MANAVENSFIMRTLKPGHLIIELKPSSTSNQLESLSYVGVFIGENLSTALTSNDQLDIEAQIGDPICLDNDYLIEELDENANWDMKSNWQSFPAGIVHLIPKSLVGLCIREGKAIIKQTETALSIHVNVRPIEKIQLISKITFLTNQGVIPIPIQFKVFNNHFNSNCSGLFEQTLAGLGKQAFADLIPFKCTASLYTGSDKRLAYLDQLIRTRVTYIDRAWTCEIAFVDTSATQLYELIEYNQSLENTADNEPVQVQLKILTADAYFIHLLPFLPAFHVQTKQVLLPTVRNAFYLKSLKSKNLKEFALDEHFNLIIYSTRQLHSHLSVSSNCPQLVQIRQLLVNKVSAGSVLKITYDIVSASGSFDLAAYASLLQQQKGELYVQVTCSLNKQTERVPIKFMFGEMSVKPHMFDEEPKEAWYARSFNYNPTQITSFLFIVIVTLVTVICIVKLKTPNPQIGQAVKAAPRQSPSVKDTSSFNPYRYFTPVVDTDVVRHRGSPYDNASFNLSGSGTPHRRSPQKSTSFGRNVPNMAEQTIVSPQRFNAFMTLDREPLRLFSVNSDVPNDSVMFGSTSRFDRSLHDHEDRS